VKVLVIGGIAFLALAGGIWFVSSKGSSSATEAVIRTAESGGNETDLLAAMLQNPKALSADDVIKLKNAGVSNKVIIQMLEKSGSKAVAKKE